MLEESLYYRPKEVAAMLGVSVRTYYRTCAHVIPFQLKKYAIIE